MVTANSTEAGSAWTRPQPGRRLAAWLAIGALVALPLAPAARAAGGVELSTPYAAVAVEPGNTASFALDITSNAERRVNLTVAAVPTGWTATIRGGGFIVDGVTAGPAGAPDITLDVEVPDTATDGSYRVSVRASGGGDAVDTLDLDLRVAAASGGSVTLTTDNPALRDDAAATFPFSLNLENGTPRELTFALSTESPGVGWIVNATPSGQTQVASFAVAAGAQETISVSVDPPDTVAARTYPITVTATAGDQSATAELQVEIVGNVAFRLTTPDQRLSTNASAGQTKDFQVLVVNDGTAPVTAVTLAGTAPTGWTVTFDPPTVAEVAPTDPQEVTVHLTPSGSAIAGDYNVTLSASTADGASESIEMRITVDTSLSWGLIGIALILLTLVGLSWVFQRYGRR
ncbi:MAG: NEW3 domain-containing protein [Chloroflexota bacterium]